MNLIDNSNELDQIEKDIDRNFKQLRCLLNEENVHFLNQPKFLPCDNSACLDCIQQSLNNETHLLNCSLCKTEHYIEDISQLKSSPSLLDQINFSAEQIEVDLINKIKIYISSLTESFKSKEELVEKVCEKAKQDVNSRIEAVKSHLDFLHREMLNSLARIKENVYAEMENLNQQIEMKAGEYKDFAENMEKMLENFEENKEQLEKDMYECQDFIEELNKFEDKFHAILRKVSFEPSEWLPDEKFINTYIGNFKLSEIVDENVPVLDTEDA